MTSSEFRGSELTRSDSEPSVRISTRLRGERPLSTRLRTPTSEPPAVGSLPIATVPTIPGTKDDLDSGVATAALNEHGRVGANYPHKLQPVKFDPQYGSRLRRLDMLEDQLRCPQPAVVVHVQPVGQVHAIPDLGATFGLIEADRL